MSQPSKSTSPDGADPGGSLPKPRLILRVGGLGNRKFGVKNGINEPPEALMAAAGSACQEVLAEMEAILLKIHKEEVTGLLHRWPEAPPQWKTHLLARVFGAPDRWRRAYYCGLRSSVFSDDKPKITVLTGGEKGGDAMIRDLALARIGGDVDYEHLRIVPEDPAAVTDGLGVGKNPPREPDLPATLDANGQPQYPPLARSEAEKRARTARQRAYGFRAQSEALRHHSDILLAIWDPDTEGKAGGTSESVAAALQERIPVIAIRLKGGERAVIHVLESASHLKALQDAALGDALPNPVWQEAVREVLGGILKFPDPEESDGKGHEKPKSYHPRAAFAVFRDNWPLHSSWPGRLWRLFDAFSRRQLLRFEAKPAETDSGKKARLENQAEANVSKESKGPSPAQSAEAKADGSFEGTFGRVRARSGSRGISGVYGELHRGGIIASYMLAALAVILAVTGGILHELHFSRWVPVFAILELAVITFMFSLEKCADTESWNAAYIESRVLAEALRMMEFLGPMGVHTPLPRLPTHLRGDRSTPQPEQLWTVWYFRALVRMAPLRLKGPAPGDLTGHRQAVERIAIDGQVAHHTQNVSKQERIHEGIRFLSKWLFRAVFACVVLHVVDSWLWHTGVIHIPALLICVGAPVLIAAMHGFDSQIERARLRQRSSSVVRLLKERSVALQALKIRDPENGDAHRNDAEAVWGLTTEALATASLLMDETAGWSLLYRNADIHAG